MRKKRNVTKLKPVVNKRLPTYIKEISTVHETKGVGGASRKYTKEYCDAIYNDFVEQNGEKDITPDKLTKWSEVSKFRDKTKGDNEGIIPRYVWYRDYKKRIDEDNAQPFILRLESLWEVNEFNIEQLCAKHGVSVKATKEFLKFGEMANIVLGVAKNSKAELEELRKYKKLYEDTKAELDVQTTRAIFYETQYKSLTVTSYSKKVQVTNKLKGNFVTLEGKTIQEVQDEFNIGNIKERVNFKEVVINSTTESGVSKKINDKVLALLDD